MLKWILLLLVGLVVYGLIRSRGVAAIAADEKKQDVISTVRCAQCGVHLDRREALISDTLNFCCEAHRTQWVSSH